jgi:hypothetical protein
MYIVTLGSYTRKVWILENRLPMVLVAKFFAFFSNEVMNFDHVLVFYFCKIVAYVHLNKSLIKHLLVHWQSLEKTFCILLNVIYLNCCYNYISCLMDLYTNLFFDDLCLIDIIIECRQINIFVDSIFVAFFINSLMDSKFESKKFSCKLWSLF